MGMGVVVERKGEMRKNQKKISGLEKPLFVWRIVSKCL
jgi:hypothetical protein